MIKVVGACTLEGSPDPIRDLKRYALLVDELQVVDIEWALRSNEREVRQELKWLENDGLIKLAEDEEHLTLDRIAGGFFSTPIMKALGASKEAQQEFELEFERLKKQKKGWKEITSCEEVLSRFHRYNALRARTLALVVGLDPDTETVCLTGRAYPKELGRGFNDAVTQADALKIVLNNMPYPGDKTSWHAISAFKAKRERPARELKNWMRDFAERAQSQAIQIGDAEKEVKDIIEGIRHDMQRERMEILTGAVHVLISGREIAEGYSHSDFEKLATGILSMVRFSMDLLKAETQNPAKPLSYVVQAQDEIYR